jgi:tetrahydromethanopterin S-methyltransferase subunit D
VSSRGKPESYVHDDVTVGEVLAPCSCDVVVVGGAPELCRSTAVGAIGSLLTSPCFRKGLRTAVVMEHAGCHHYLFYWDEPDGTPVLFLVA